MKKSIIFSIIAVSVLMVTSCDDYLDVTPSDKQTADQLYATKSGFYAASNGIYDALASDDLYGQNLTWGAIELMCQSYSPTDLATNYKSLVENSYTYATSASVLSSIWGKAYSTILAANLLIDEVDKQEGILTNTEEKLLKGEMLAVRALLHLDMLRLFGPSPAYGIDEPAIPYNNSTDVYAHDLVTIAEADSMVLVDLNAAEDLLKNDPIIENGPMMSAPEGAESVQLRYRQYRMNYYAVKALKARAYAWVGDTEKAYAAATELINDPKVQQMFPPVDPNKLLANTSNPDRVFSSEVLMGIYDKDRNQVYTNYFASSAPKTQRLMPYSTYLVGNYSLFANLLLGLESNDYRFQSQWEAASTTGVQGHSLIKYKEIDKPDPNDEDSEYYYAKMIPLVRMHEMYLIASEAAPDISGSVYWLNQARIRRGLYDFDLVGLGDYMTMYWSYGYGGIFLSNEYRREFWGEGQWFYFAKRYDIAGYGVGVGYYTENGAAPQMPATFDVKPPLPIGEMK